MPNILLAGGFEEDAKANDALKSFVREIAGEVVREGHTLLGGCQTSLDAEAALAAQAHYVRAWMGVNIV